MEYYAHSKKGQPVKDWQKLNEHLQNVANLAAIFAADFASDAWARNAAWLHDLGKATQAFQSYLMQCNNLDDSEYDTDGSMSNHASAGAALSMEKFGISGRILAYIIAGHHAGLPDWYSCDGGNAVLEIRLREGQHNLGYIRNYADSILPNIIHPQPPMFARTPENVHLWVRMIFSCLADADFLDTEAFMQPEQATQRSAFKLLPELKSLFDVHMSKLADSAQKTQVNDIRQEVLASCRNAAIHAPGLFSLTVPTGGGKTLSGMAFALDHAVQHGKKRIIYVIPYTSIIEQTAAILRNIFGDNQVIEHHSNLDSAKETQHSRLAAENWDAPIIVTTNVQFFESLYAAKSSRCRKLHNLVNSVVILDEAQLLPPELLTPCVAVMNQLTRHYGVTMVLATATQPSLPGLDIPTEIIPQNLKLYKRLKRTQINMPDMTAKTDWADIAERLKQHSQVLCIVNTRRDCHDLFELMPEGTIHLSALMCGRHRSAVIRLIHRRLKKKMQLRVISTQLVEAGVDIDFPVVYRALAGLDSIAQGAGRCNREGKLNADGKLGQVHVFIPPKAAPRGLLLKGENTTRELVSISDFNPDYPQEYTRYFNLFYSKVNDTGSQFYDWLVKDANPSLHFQFRTAAANFKLIKDQNQPVIVRYNGSETWINQVRVIGPTRENMRRLQRYTVNLPVYMVEKMKSDGMLEEIYEGILAQAMPNLYNKKIGLDVFRENLPVEDLIQ